MFNQPRLASFLRHPASSLLCLAIVLVYIWMAFDSGGVGTLSASSALRWGASSYDATTDGQPWRLVTALFLHGSLTHLLFNTLVLFDIGSLLERRTRASFVLLAFFVSGVAATLGSLLWNHQMVTVGASGAVLGLAGAAVALLALERLEPGAEHASLGSEIKSLLLCFALTVGYGFIASGIDNTAHIVGFAAGLVIGLVYWACRKLTLRQRWSKGFSELAVLIVGAVALLLVWRAVPHDDFAVRRALPPLFDSIEKNSDLAQAFGWPDAPPFDAPQLQAEWAACASKATSLAAKPADDELRALVGQIAEYCGAMQKDGAFNAARPRIEHPYPGQDERPVTLERNRAIELYQQMKPAAMRQMELLKEHEANQ